MWFAQTAVFENLVYAPGSYKLTAEALSAYSARLDQAAAVLNGK